MNTAPTNNSTNWPTNHANASQKVVRNHNTKLVNNQIAPKITNASTRSMKNFLKR